MEQLDYLAVALFLISVALTGLFYLAWLSFERQRHVLTWTGCFACSSVQWFSGVANTLELIPFIAYWTTANYLGAMVSVLSLLGYQQRAGGKHLSAAGVAGLAAIPFTVTMVATYVWPHAGISGSALTLYTVFNSAWIVRVLYARGREKRAIEWVVIACYGVYMINQSVLGSIALSSGSMRDEAAINLYNEGLLLTLPTFYVVFALLALIIIASDLALKAKRLAEREMQLRRRDSDRNWDTLLDVIGTFPEPVAITNAQLELTACNAAFRELLELTEEECTTTQPVDLASECLEYIVTIEGRQVETREDVLEIFLQVLETGARVEIISKDAETFLLGCGHLSSGDKIIVASDVSQLNAARQRLETAISSMPIGFALFDKNGSVIACNTRYENVLGASESWIKAQSFEALIEAGVARVSPEELDDVVSMGHEELRKAIKERGHFNRTALLNDGKWYDLSVQPIADGGFIAMSRDITKRRLLELELERSEAQLREVLGQQPFPVVVIRKRDNQFVFYGRAAAAILRLDEQPNDLDTSFFALSERCVSEPVFGSLEMTNMPIREVSYERADGERFPALASALDTKFSGEDARVVSFVDISNIKEMQQEIATQRDALYQSEKLNALGTLLAGVAHELNNPLTIITTNSHVLLKQAQDKQAIDRLHSISDAADRCARIIRSFLDMARKGTNERLPFDVGECIRKAIEISNLGYSLHEVRVDSSIDVDIPLLNGSPDQFCQAMLNLIVNAKQALAEQAPPRTISVKAHFDGESDAVLINVIDNGPGVAEADHDRVFEPFFTTKAVGEGTGMGLALVRGIVRSHGGTIRLISEGESGCHFEIRVPVFAQVKPETDADSFPVEKAESKRILVVDDEETVLSSLADVLSLAGHSVRAVDSAKKALLALERDEFDVLITDVRMPVMTGEELFNRIQQQFPEMVNKTAFITGNSIQGEALAFLESTKRPYLGKPFLPEEVSRLVRQACHGNQSD